MDLPYIIRYELRYCPPPKNLGEDEAVVASHPADAPPEFLTHHGLPAPGAPALFKVYPITTAKRAGGARWWI